MESKAGFSASSNTLGYLGLSLDDVTIQRLSKAIALELKTGKSKLPIHMDDFTGIDSPFLLEEAIVWLTKLRLAARENEWSASQIMEIASVHLKHQAARWFSLVKNALNDALHLGEGWLSVFETKFHLRFILLPPVSSSEYVDMYWYQQNAEYLASVNIRYQRKDQDLKIEYAEGVSLHETRGFNFLRSAFEEAVNAVSTKHAKQKIDSAIGRELLLSKH